MTTMSIRLPVEEKEWLIRLGQITGRTHTEYIREFIRSEIREKLIEELERLNQLEDLQVDRVLEKLMRSENTQGGTEPDVLPHTDSIDVEV